MRAHLLVLALGAAVVSASSAAEEPRLPVQTAQQPVDAPRPLVVASADQAPAPASDPQQQGAPAPKRHARVTSCRCGGDENPSQ